ncbi:MAG: biotin-dependent carboxyltransferase family protein [Akkermansiaceae bacterium]
MHFQDLGRYGYAHLGVSQGGPIDLHAFCWANYLLGNCNSATSLEVTVGNASFLALEDSVIAIAGAEMNGRIDDSPIQNWGSHIILKGQTLKLGYARTGSHAYLAVQGGFCAERVLGSSSTVVRNDVGGLLSAGVELCVKGNFLFKPAESKLTPSRFIPDYDEVCKIQVVLAWGQEREFSSALLNTRFRVSPESDRMGRNLIADEALPRLDGIISEGISLGSIQLPPSGNPIVLLNDRQTQGGYAKVGNVARVDLPLLVQARAGAKIRFMPVSHESAREQWVDFVRFFRL